ncbi:hypothetical protein NDU88_003003 [Pleurodeles waltl]|uniref:Uncharacterized protein n=1 Tax=Pleurodeles waltl TaxID=8319 RepID=A0AAV7LFQ7_PLEWA|nr:hypothetical protein NDU88_003003 [Pleurodeles waltl]
MLHNLALRRQVPFLQEDGPDDGVVAAVEPVDSDEEEAEEEDIDIRDSVIQQYFQWHTGTACGVVHRLQGWGAGVVVLWRCLLSTSAGGGGGQFIVRASVRGPLECHGVPHGVLYVLQHPYDGALGRADGSEFLPEPQILFLLHALGLLKLGQDRSHRLLGVVVCSHDGREGLVESGFQWPVRPLSHGSPPSSPVFLCLRPLDRVPTTTVPRSLLLGW